MRVVYTQAALNDLDAILGFIGAEFPDAYPGFEMRMRAIERRIGEWPHSAQAVAQRLGVRMVPLIRYPYKIFYRVDSDEVVILHVHHAARMDP